MNEMGEIFIILALVLLNGLFAMAEISLVSARRSSLQASAKRGSWSARSLNGILLSSRSLIWMPHE